MPSQWHQTPQRQKQEQPQGRCEARSAFRSQDYSRNVAGYRGSILSVGMASGCALGAMSFQSWNSESIGCDGWYKGDENKRY